MTVSATIDNRAKWCCRSSTDGDKLKNSFAPLHFTQKATVSFSSYKDIADIFMFLSAFTNTSTEISVSESCIYVSDTDAYSLISDTTFFSTVSMFPNCSLFTWIYLSFWDAFSLIFLFPTTQTMQFLNCRQAFHILDFYVASIEQSPVNGPLFLVGPKPKPFRNAEQTT